MKSALLLAGALVTLAAAAHGEPRVFELSVPSVQCSYSSEKAEVAARKADPNLYAKADHRAHKILVRFEEERTSIDAISAALSAQGYEVKGRKQLR